MQHDRLIELASQFKAAGVDAAELRRMQTELDMLESPPGLFSRLTRSARAAAGRQWANIVGELKESGELMGILRRRIAEGERLSEAEADKVRAQVLDMMRMVPAGVIAVANSALPVPGTGLLTPWILARLGLMPSRWREAHLLDQLRKASEHLREQGLHEQAARIDALGRELEDEADARDRAAHDAALLTHPNQPDLLYEAALLAERIGRMDVLEANLRAVIRIKPDHAHAYNALGYSFADRNERLPEAHGLIAKALALAPNDPFILDSMGWVLYRMGNAAGAIENLERAWKLRSDPEIAAHLGEVLWKSGRRDEATRTWRDAERAHPGNEVLTGVIKRFLP